MVGLDPSPTLLGMARLAAVEAGVPIEVVAGEAEAVPFDDREFDTVVLTFTLCSVRDARSALSQVRRVLKPGGTLLFCEYGSSPDFGVRRWQRRIEPMWSRLAGGCHLTRAVGEALHAGGFKVESGGQGYLKGAPRFAGWLEWGTASVGTSRAPEGSPSPPCPA